MRWHHRLWLQAPLGAASLGTPAALSQQCRTFGHSLTAQATPLPNLMQGASPGVTSYERRATARWEASTGLVQRKVMAMKVGQQQSCFVPGCSQLSRDLHKTQGHAETAGSLGTGDVRLTIFGGLVQLHTGECDGSWVGLGDPIALMALSPAKSSMAFPRAGKELDIQIHFSEQLMDPFFTTHSPAPRSLAQTGPMFAEQ